MRALGVQSMDPAIMQSLWVMHWGTPVCLIPGPMIRIWWDHDEHEEDVPLCTGYAPATRMDVVICAIQLEHSSMCSSDSGYSYVQALHSVLWNADEMECWYSVGSTYHAMHHQSTDVMRDQMEECSGDGAGAMMVLCILSVWGEATRWGTEVVGVLIVVWWCDGVVMVVSTECIPHRTL